VSTSNPVIGTALGVAVTLLSMALFLGLLAGAGALWQAII
jgi:hypothetical protein